MRHKLTALLCILYLLLFGHFLFSNYVRTIGPSIPMCVSALVWGDCIVHCPNITGALNFATPAVTYDENGNIVQSVDKTARGFPFMTRWFVADECPGISAVQTSSQNEASNSVYMVITTLIFATLIVATYQPARRLMHRALEALKRRPTAAKLSIIISTLQILLAGAVLVTYFLFRPLVPEGGYTDVSQAYDRLSAMRFILLIVFVGLSIINVTLLLWEGLIARKTKEVDRWLFGPGLVVVLLWAVLILIEQIFPPVWQGI